MRPIILTCFAAAFYILLPAGIPAPMTRPAKALLNWSSLRHNYQIAKSRCAGGQAWAVIKANGYGHGLLGCARALSSADGFAVACMDEAVILREAGIQRPLLVLQGAYDSQEWQLASELGIELMLHHPQQWLDRQVATLVAPVAVWLKVNSGMNRLGLRPQQALALYQQVSNDPLVQPRLFASHFAEAEEVGSRSFASQLECMNQEWPLPLSLCNSAAILRADKPVDAISRPGIMLYGSSPLAGVSAVDLGLKPVMQLVSSIIAVHEVGAGEAVGYGGDWIARRDSRIGVVAMGYGDGYPRSMPAGAPVAVAGQICPLIGRVSMDMITVDLTDCPQADIGSAVELWGEQIAIDQLASLCGTISYELFCQVTARVPRITRDLPSDNNGQV